MMHKLTVGIAVAAISFAVHAAWYDNPSILKLVPLATGSSATEDPHFMNKSADDATLLVNMQASNDNDGPILLDIAELTDLTTQGATFRKVFAKPSAIGGAQFKGGAVSSDLGLALLGSGKADLPRAAFMTGVTNWVKGANLFLQPAIDIAADGLDFGTGSTYLYSNIYDGGGLARFVVSATGALSGKVTKTTAAARVRNISVHHVGGKELVYYGEGADNTTAAKIYAMDVTDADAANWTETELKLGDTAITAPGVVTNVKLSNEDSETPILYALTDGGTLTIWKLAADGLSAVEEVKSFTADQMKLLAGGATTAKFRNFEVTKDGATAFIINRTDTHNVKLAVLKALPSAYIESDGTSYIDTGYTPTTNTAIYADFEYEAVAAQNFIFEAGDSVSATNANHKAYFRHYISGTGYNAYAMNGNLWWNNDLVATVGQRFQELLDAPNLTTTQTTPTESITKSVPASSAARAPASTTLKLFSNYEGNGNKAKARIYEMRIYEGGILVRDFTPAKRDGYVGFHDSVTGDFICNRSGFTFGGGEALAEIEDPYIVSDGTAGINTGVQCQPGLKVEVDYQLWSTNIVKQWRIVSTDAGSDPRLSAYVNGNGNIALTSGDTWGSTRGADPNTGIAADTNRHTVVLGDGGAQNHYMIGRTILKSIAAVPYTKRSTIQIALLATPKTDYGKTFSNIAQARIYRARFWVGDTLIRDFQPRTLNGVAGLEDVVQGGFYTASGYTASANVKEGLSSTPAYIESNGSFFSYVNTFYKATPKTKLEVDYQMLDLSAGKIVCGTYGGSVGATVLFWHDNSYRAIPQAKDGNYSASTMNPQTYVDSGRHVASIDIPGATLSIRDVNGTVESSGSCTMTANSNWPILLFSGSKDVYGHPYSSQNATCRIYGAKIWEKEGDEYILKHNFEPVLLDGIPGFRDAVIGKFHSGDNLTGGGAIKTIADDSYLENPKTGGCYFDTGYSVTANTSVWVDFMPLVQQTTQQFPYEAGTGNTSGKMYIRAYGNGSSGTGDYAHAFGTDTYKTANVPYQPNVRVQVFNDTVNRRFKVLRDGVELGGTNYAASATTSVSASSSTTLKILCCNDMKANSCKARLYGVKIYEDGVLVRDYVPSAQAGAGVLYDKVNGTVLAKASTANAFVVSDDLTADNGWYAEELRDGDAYIESDGTQVINTGYYGKPNSRYEIDFQFTAIKGQNRPFGVVVPGGYNAELYVQGTATGSGNVAFGVGDTWKGQYTNKGSDLNRHRAMLDVSSHTFAYSGFGIAKETTAYVATGSATVPLALFTNNGNSDFSGWLADRVAKMRLYSFRIYEANELVHQYLPYKNGTTIGLYDTVTGNVLTKLPASTTVAANDFIYGGEGCGAYAGEVCALTAKPADKSVTSGQTKTLTAYAPGAVGYVWTMNGVEIVGATTGELTVLWQRHRGAKSEPERSDVYTVKPIFLVDGEEVVGEAASATVVSNSPGLSILIR